MSVVRFSFYRLVVVTAPTGAVHTEREEIRSPIRYDSIRPAPGTEIRLHGFPPCTCPQAPVCHAREAARPRGRRLPLRRPPTPKTPQPPSPAECPAAISPHARPGEGHRFLPRPLPYRAREAFPPPSLHQVRRAEGTRRCWPPALPDRQHRLLHPQYTAWAFPGGRAWARHEVESTLTMLQSMRP